MNTFLQKKYLHVKPNLDEISKKKNRIKKGFNNEMFSVGKLEDQII